MHDDYETENDTTVNRVMREYIFDASFIVALNALEGREITGSGLTNLRACINDGPIMIIIGDGFRVSHQHQRDFEDNQDPKKVLTGNFEN